jgi:hypothetical protein
MLDAEVMQAMPWSGLDALVWLCRRYGWDDVPAVEYLATLRRGLRHHQDNPPR